MERNDKFIGLFPSRSRCWTISDNFFSIWIDEPVFFQNNVNFGGLVSTSHSGSIATRFTKTTVSSRILHIFKIRKLDFEKKKKWSPNMGIECNVTYDQHESTNFSNDSSIVKWTFSTAVVELISSIQFEFDYSRHEGQVCSVHCAVTEALAAQDHI